MKRALIKKKLMRMSGGCALLILLHGGQSAGLAADRQTDVPPGPLTVAESQPSLDDQKADASPVSASVEAVTPPEQPPSDGKGGSSPPAPAAPILDSSSTRLSFQALLKDAGGVPLAGPVNLRFQIYTSPGGVAVGAPVDVNGVALTNGVADTQVPIPTSSFDGTGREMGVRVNLGVELTPRIPLTAVPYAYRVDRVASEELDDTIALGRGAAPLASGLLSVHNGAQAQASIELNGVGHRISTYGNDGLEQIRLYGPSWGELWLNDNTGNNRTVFLSAQSDSGGFLELTDNAGAARVQMLGDSTGTGGEISVFDDDGTETVEILGSEVASEGGQILIRNAAGSNTIELDGDSGDAAFVTLRNTTGLSRISLDGDSSGAGLITVIQNDGSTGVSIDGDNGTNIGGAIRVADSVSATRVQLLGESAGTGGEISVFDDDGTETVEILGAETSTTGGQILVRDSTGATQIEIDGEFGVTGDPGRIITPVLQITGGADLSEQFDINGPFEPGMVVCIDEYNPGKLVPSTSAYDRKVAGVVAGAGGVRPGLVMGQRNKNEVDGKNAVALSGRIYCKVDASTGPVKPGDLLTTSNTAGHAMKVADHTQAQGAILGKAMSSLTTGRGLVLVLVTLQ